MNELFTQDFLIILNVLLEMMVFVVISGGFLLVYKEVLDLLFKSVDFNAQLTKQDNVAFGEAFSGHLYGLGVALSGALVGAFISSESAPGELAHLLIGCVIALVLYPIGLVLTSILSLRRLSLYQEIINDKNIGAAYIFSGASMVNGLVIAASLCRSGDFNISAIFWYWIFGQVVVFAACLVYQIITPGDIFTEVKRNYLKFRAGGVGVAEKDANGPRHLLGRIVPDAEVEGIVQNGQAELIGGNSAAGLAFKYFLFAVGIVVAASLAFASGNIRPEIFTASVIVVFTMFVFTVLGRFLIADGLILRHAKLSHEVFADKNIAAAKVEAAVYLCIALFLSLPIMVKSVEAMKVNAVEAAVAKAMANQGQTISALPDPADANSVSASLAPASISTAQAPAAKVSDANALPVSAAVLGKAPDANSIPAPAKIN